MAKRKLAGAALAAYNRKRSQSVALVPVASTTIAARPRRARPARRKRRAYAPQRRSGVSSLVNMVTSRLPPMLGSAAYGWLTKAPDAKELADYLAAQTQGKAYQGGSIQLKVYGLPYVEALGRKATQGIALAAVSAFTGGVISRVAGHLSNAALHAWAFDLGRNDASFDLASKVAGVQTAYVGSMDVDNFDADDADD